MGLNDVEVIDRQSVAEMVPQLTLDDIRGGVFRQQDGFINPLAVMRGFTGAALRDGCRLFLETEVTGIEITSNAVSAVNTNRGRISTPVVINAAGPWAARVAGFADIELPVKPLRRQALGVTSQVEFPADLPMVIDLSTGFHFRPYPAGSRNELLLVWADPDEVSGFDSEFGGTFQEQVLAHACRRVPCLSDAVTNPVTSRAGLYEMTPDHHAIIDRAETVEGLYFVNGFSGHGVMHSPAAGKMAAEIVLAGSCDLFDNDALGMARFRDGRVSHEATLI
jgi:sarcosine oxidase subunit beta